MKTKISRAALQAWLLSKGCEIIDERLASSISTNIYLNNKSVLALFDNGTVSLQGKPPKEFIADFKLLCAQQTSAATNSINAMPEDHFDIPDLIDIHNIFDEEIEAYLDFSGHPSAEEKTEVQRFWVPPAGYVPDNSGW